jgi:hypothetical protein
MRDALAVLLDPPWARAAGEARIGEAELARLAFLDRIAWPAGRWLDEELLAMKRRAGPPVPAEIASLDPDAKELDPALARFAPPSEVSWLCDLPRGFARALLDWLARHGEGPPLELDLVLRRHELGVLDPLVAMAERWPDRMLDLLVPCASPRIVPIAARLLASSDPALHEPARAWLAWNGECSAVGLARAVLDRPSPARDHAELTLRERIHEHGRDAIARHVARHSPAAMDAIDAWYALDVATTWPSSAPTLPAWLDRDALPPLASLPPSARDAAVMLLASSRLDAAHPAVPDVREVVGPSALGSLAIGLAEAWIAEGRPREHVWMLHAIAHAGDDRAVAWLDRRDDLEKSDTLAILKHSAARAAAIVLESHGLLLAPESMLEDAPALGFDAHGRRALSPRTTLSIERGGLDLVLRDASGAAIAGDAMEVRERDLAAALVDRTISALARRWEQAMCSGARTGPLAFRRAVLEHPIAGRLAQSVVWGLYDAEGTLVLPVRIAEDATLADVRDREVALDPTLRIGIPHPLELGPEACTRFAALFDAYELVQPFEQTRRSAFDLPDPSRAILAWRRGAGAALRGRDAARLCERGWREIQHLHYSRSIHGLELVLVPLALHEDPPRWRIAVRAPGGASVPPAQLSKVALSELLRDLHAIS